MKMNNDKNSCVQNCADHVQKRYSYALSSTFIWKNEHVLCGCVLKTIANVYSSVTFELAYFNKY